MITPLVPLLLVLVSILLAKRSREADIAAFERVASTPYVPIVLGLVNALLVLWVFGFEPNPVPQIQDEAAYLLQAGIFARGRWTEAARPLPEFFAQMHVFTTPVLAAKYPPGTSLFLTPFVAIGAPVLAPALLAGLTGVLIFVLARRVTIATVATLAWVVWSTAPTVLRWQATFLSQTLTITLWLAAFYFLLKYRQERSTSALIAVAAVIGFCAITRPVTAVALALPIGVVIMRDAWPVRAWRPLAVAALTGTAIVAILPLQNRMTTGEWGLSPLVKYSREYLPSDFPGFGLDSVPGQLASLPPDLEQTRQELFDIRRQHVAPALARTLLHRTLHSLAIVFSGWGVGLLAFMLVGAIVMPAAGRFALAMSAGLLLAYSFHSHRAQWSQYYLEAAPAYAFAAAAGVWGVASWVIRGWSSLRRRTPWDVAEPRVAVATLVAAIVLAVPRAAQTPSLVADLQRGLTLQRQFHTVLEIVSREAPKAIVFVEYGARHNPHFSLVRNVPDLATARTWVAYERGLDDLRLMRLAPDRRAYIYEAGTGRLMRLPPLAELERLVAAR